MNLSKLHELVMDREAQQVAVHRVTKSQTRLTELNNVLSGQSSFQCYIDRVIFQELYDSCQFQGFQKAQILLLLLLLSHLVMSDSVQPHGRQPTRLHHPWDSPGKNTGVGAIAFSAKILNPV